MEFFIKKNATLPVLKMQVVKDGRAEYQHFMDLLETSTIAFSMVDVATGIPKIASQPAYIEEKTLLNQNASVNVGSILKNLGMNGGPSIQAMQQAVKRVWQSLHHQTLI